jgi:hypothetical protein
MAMSSGRWWAGAPVEGVLVSSAAAWSTLMSSPYNGCRYIPGTVAGVRLPAYNGRRIVDT